MLNRWPYTEVVSAVCRETLQCKREDLRILEIGCGAGNNIWFLADEGYRTSGIDLSPTAIEYARKRLSDLGLVAELNVGNAVDLPWESDTFDLVFDRGGLSLNPYPEVARILGEVRRVLKKKGVFYAFTMFGISHPDRRFGMEVSRNTYDNFTDGLFCNAGMISFFSFDTIAELFGQFSLVEAQRKPSFSAGETLIAEEYRVRAVR